MQPATKTLDCPGEIRVWSTDIETVVDQVFGNASKHVQAGQDILHVVKNVSLALG